jgi:hypothetical protein
MTQISNDYPEILTYYDIKEKEIKKREHNIYTNLTYIATLLGLLYLIFEIYRDSDKKYFFQNILKIEYINEISYIIILFILLTYTMVNSMYYHGCGGILNKEDEYCESKHLQNDGYNFEISKKNDFVFAALSTIGVLLLVINKFSGFKIYILFLSFFYLNIVYSFTKVEYNFIIANIPTLIFVFTFIYYNLKNILLNPCQNKKFYFIRNILLILNLIFFIASLVFFMDDDYLEIKKIYNNRKETNSNEEEKSKEKTKILKLIEKREYYHGLWHVFGALSGACLVLYKAFDIKNYELDGHINKRIAYTLKNLVDNNITTNDILEKDPNLDIVKYLQRQKINAETQLNDDIFKKYFNKLYKKYKGREFVCNYKELAKTNFDLK